MRDIVRNRDDGDGSRSMSLQSELSDIFELLLLHLREYYIYSNDLWFGSIFVRNLHGTSMCISQQGCSQFVVCFVVEYLCICGALFFIIIPGTRFAHLWPAVFIWCSIISGRWSCQHKFLGLSLKMQPQNLKWPHKVQLKFTLLHLAVISSRPHRLQRS